MKLFSVVVAAFVAVCLTGCAHGAKQGNDLQGYAYQVKNAIETEMPEITEYTGKLCTVRIDMARDGLINSAKAEGGDPELCEAALAALRRVDRLPAPPSEEIWQIFHNAPLDFRP